MHFALWPLVGLILGWALAKRRDGSVPDPDLLEFGTALVCIFSAAALGRNIYLSEQHHTFYFLEVLGVTSSLLWNILGAFAQVVGAGLVGYIAWRMYRRRNRSLHFVR